MVTETVESALGEESQVEVSGIKFYSIFCLANHMIKRYYLKAHILLCKHANFIFIVVFLVDKVFLP
jgi:radical SAM superfamily enzyme